jgi:hypothetical protein
MSLQADVRQALKDQLTSTDAKLTPLFLTYSGGKKPTRVAVDDFADLVSAVCELRYVLAVLTGLVDK